MSSTPSELAALVRAELPRLYAFAYLMVGARLGAHKQVARALAGLADDPAALLTSANPGDFLLSRVARSVERALGRKADQSFVILDNLLRSDATLPIDPDQSPIDGDLERLPVLLWELKRTCLASVLGCLPPGVRVSFITTDIFGYPPAEAADLLGIRESAFRVRLTRARRRLDDYLAPRCAHVERHNACYCEGRLTLALDTNFVELPPHTGDVPEAAYDAEPEHRDIADLYRTLPFMAPSPHQFDELVAVATTISEPPEAELPEPELSGPDDDSDA